MSNRPDLCTRQWWTLHSLVARYRSEKDDPSFSAADLGSAELYGDLRTLAREGCIVIASACPANVRIGLLRRGERWVEQWRKEQVSHAVQAFSREEVA